MVFIIFLSSKVVPLGPIFSIFKKEKLETRHRFEKPLPEWSRLLYSTVRVGS